MTTLEVWQETAGSDSNPTDPEILNALRVIWKDAEAEIDICQAKLSHADDPFQAERRLDDAIARCEAAESRYTRAWFAFCTARLALKMEVE